MPAEPRAGQRYWLFKTEPIDVLVRRSMESAGANDVLGRRAELPGSQHAPRPDRERRPRLRVSLQRRPTGIAGIAEVAHAGYPDKTAFDPDDPHYDPKSKRDSPTWYMVDIRAVKALPRFITLEELRSVAGLEKMVLLQKGSRLSIQPVRPEEWEIINSMA